MKKAQLLCLAGILISVLSTSACGEVTGDTTADLNTKQLNKYIKGITSTKKAHGKGVFRVLAGAKHYI